MKKTIKTRLICAAARAASGSAQAVLGGLDVAFSDISPECIALAKKNAGRNGVQAQFFIGDLYEPVIGRFDLILCNPPYIPDAELPQACARGSLRTPVGARGRSGWARYLPAYRLSYEKYLNPGGALLLEVGKGQAGAVERLFGRESTVLLDVNGIERVVCVRL